MVWGQKLCFGIVQRMMGAEQLAQKRLVFADLLPGLAELELAVVKSEPRVVSVDRHVAVVGHELVVPVAALAAVVHMDSAWAVVTAGSGFAVEAAASAVVVRKANDAVAAVQVGIPSVAALAA